MRPLDQRVRSVPIDVGAAVWAARQIYIYNGLSRQPPQENPPTQVRTATEAGCAVEAKEVDDEGARADFVNQMGVRFPERELIDESDHDEEGKNGEPAPNHAAIEHLAGRHGEFQTSLSGVGHASKATALRNRTWRLMNMRMAFGFSIAPDPTRRSEQNRDSLCSSGGSLGECSVSSSNNQKPAPAMTSAAAGLQRLLQRPIKGSRRSSVHAVYIHVTTQQVTPSRVRHHKFGPPPSDPLGKS